MRGKIDTILLAAALFGISGALLTYNIMVSDGGEVMVSLSELAEYNSDRLLSEIAANHFDERIITGEEALEVSADITNKVTPLRDYELLEPIIKPN